MPRALLRLTSTCELAHKSKTNDKLVDLNGKFATVGLANFLHELPASPIALHFSLLLVRNAHRPHRHLRVTIFKMADKVRQLSSVQVCHQHPGIQTLSPRRSF